jgi:hypothetical protein
MRRLELRASRSIVGDVFCINVPCSAASWASPRTLLVNLAAAAAAAVGIIVFTRHLRRDNQKARYVNASILTAPALVLLNTLTPLSDEIHFDPVTRQPDIIDEHACPDRDNFLLRLRSRKYDTWQAKLDNKLVSKAFARHVGVRTPRMHFCGSLSELPTEWPRSWGDRFVCKPLNAYSDRGVLLLWNGTDLLKGGRYRGREDVVQLYNGGGAGRQNMSENERAILRKLAGQTILCEELVHRRGRGASDYKFYMFGDQIGALYVVSNRSKSAGATSRLRPCGAWFDANGTRMDRHGCVVQSNVAYTMPGLCRNLPTPLSPDVRARLFEAVRALGRAAGEPFRIDMYVGEDGTPMLGEFTSMPMRGTWHCAVPSRPTGVADPCHLGRLWRDRGPRGAPPLPAPKGFEKLDLSSLEQQCAFARRHLMTI